MPFMEAAIEAIAQAYSLDKELVRRLEEDFRALRAETVEEYVVRRHRELQKTGWANPAIFSQLQHEVGEGRFRVARPTLRQVRRIIYG
jgi:hypothetical protein